MNTTQSFSGLSRACVPSLREVCREELRRRGGAANLLSSQPRPTAMAVDGSECLGCSPKLSDHFFQLRKRRVGLPRRKAGQGRWPGQVALVSRFPAAVFATYPTEPCHPLPSRNRTPWLGAAAMWALIGGLRAMGTGGRLFPARQPGPPCCLPSGQELRLYRGTGTYTREVSPAAREDLVFGTYQMELARENARMSSVFI